ncbi:MAG: hypothetical protein RIT81_00745 [Deltaproteobacteria bacterium]
MQRRELARALGFLLTIAACGETADDSGSRLRDAGAADHDAGAADHDAGAADHDAGLARDGGPARDGGVFVSDPFDPVAASDTLSRAACAYRTRCEPAFHAFLGHSEQDCVDEALVYNEAVFALYDQIVRAGRLHFDQAAFDACIASYATVDCVDVSPPSCFETFTGTTAVGEPCAYAQECAGGAWCSAEFGTCGQCERPAGEGESCRASLCDDGLLCVRSGNNSVCVSVDAAVGEPCGTVGTGLCAGRLQCVGTGAERSCARPADVGDACDPTVATAPDCHYRGNVTCAGGVCAPTVWGGEGASCAAPNRCDGTAVCNTATMSCDAPPGFGEPCTDVCAPGFFCSFRGVCDLPAQRGLGCSAHEQCALGLWCIDRVCGDLTYPACR